MPKCGDCGKCNQCEIPQYDIQDRSVDTVLMTSSSAPKEAKRLREIGVWRHFIFDGLNGIDRWNCAPPGKF